MSSSCVTCFKPNSTACNRCKCIYYCNSACQRKKICKTMSTRIYVQIYGFDHTRETFEFNPWIKKAQRDKILKKIVELLISKDPEAFIIYNNHPITDAFFPNQLASTNYHANLIYVYDIFNATHRFKQIFTQFAICGLSGHEMRVLNVSGLLHMIMTQPLFAKYVFKHSSLWKDILMVFMDVLLENGDICDAHAAWIANVIELGLKYFKAKHYKYLIKENYHESVIGGLINLWKYHSKELEEREYMNLASGNLRHICLAIIGSIQSMYCYCHKNNKAHVAKIYDQYHSMFVKKLNSLDYNAYNICILLLPSMPQNNEAIYRMWNNHKMAKLEQKKCAWFKCQKSYFVQKKQKNKPFFICKGCKLVYYCRRNHQKKDWRFIHSQQCYRLRT
eukprot:285962_1